MKSFLIILMIVQGSTLFPSLYESVEGRLFRQIDEGDVAGVKETLKCPNINFRLRRGISIEHNGVAAIENLPFINYAIKYGGDKTIEIISMLLEAGATFLPTIIRKTETHDILEQQTTEQVSREQKNIALHDFLGKCFAYSTPTPTDSKKLATAELFLAIRNYNAQPIDEKTWTYEPDVQAIGYEGCTALDLARRKFKNRSQVEATTLLEKMEMQAAFREK